MNGGLFRPESPWLSSKRTIKTVPPPVELTSISATLDPPNGQPPEGEEPPEGGDVEFPVRSPGPEKNGVKVSGLTASWNESAEKATLANISFEVTEVSDQGGFHP